MNDRDLTITDYHSIKEVFNMVKAIHIIGYVATVLVSIIAFIAICNSAQAQPECFTPPQTNYSLMNQISSVCYNYVNYIPDISDNYNNTPILTYKINIHLLRHSDGTGIYQYSDIPTINQMVDWVNYIFSNIDQPVLVTNPPAQYINDSRIRVKLMGIYFHDNDNFYLSNEICGSSLYDNFGINKTSELNVFFYQHPTANGGCGPSPFYLNMLSSPLNWATSQGLAHELGHCIGLAHTFACGGTTCYEGDNLPDTYTPDCNTAFVDCGVNAVPSCGNAIGISNNLMGYNKCRSYLSPLQMAIMHKNSITDINHRRLLDCEYNSNIQYFVN